LRRSKAVRVLQRFFLSAPLVLAGLTLLLPLGATEGMPLGQAQLPVVKVQPASQVVGPGTTDFGVEIAVENTSELGAFDFTLQFDSDLIHLVNAEVGSLLGSTGRTVICPPPIIGEHSVRFGCNTVGLSPPGPSGSGALGLLRFSPNATGSSSLVLLDCQLSSPLGEPLPASCEGGSLITLVPPAFCPVLTTVPGLPLMRIDPPCQIVNRGEELSVNVAVVDTDELGDFEFTLQYDPEVLQPVAVELGPFLGSTGRTIVCQGPTITDRTIRFGCNTVGPAPPGPSGSGVLANLRFFAHANGISPLFIVQCELSTLMGDPVAAECQSGTAVVGLPQMQKDADTVAEGVQPTNNLWLVKNGCTNPAEGMGCLLVHNLVFFVAFDAAGNLFPEGVGAWEEQIKFDHAVFDLNLTEGPFLGSTGRPTNCTMSIIAENDIRFACVSTGSSPPGPAGAGLLASIDVRPDADMLLRLRPTKDNGVVSTLLDENCELSDILGNPLPGTLPGGLLPVCDDATITVRMLEGDANLDCEVNVLDEQAIAFRYGSFFGLLLYDYFYDLEPKLIDFDIDIKDLQFVFGRDGSTCQNPLPDQPPLPPPGS